MQSFGIVIGGSILQNKLQSNLPNSFLSTLPEGVQIAYSVIPQIPSLPEALQGQVRHAFGESACVIWKVMEYEGLYWEKIH